MRAEQITLEGRLVRLEPLAPQHLGDLCAAGLDPEVWRWTREAIASREEMRGYIEQALEAQREGSALPFATVLRAEGRAVGSTRFGDIDRANRHLEIGWTWIGRAWQRTSVNTEAKYLMLRHAFEELGCLRVAFKTDVLNAASRAAILRLGAREEGVFRRHIVTTSGRIRDSVYYSIIDEEWPSVRAGLEQKLAAGR